MSNKTSIYRVVVRNKSGWSAHYVESESEQAVQAYAVKYAKGRQYLVQFEDAENERHVRELMALSGGQSKRV